MYSRDDIGLRALEPDDLHWLYGIENDTELWAISGTVQPYSMELLRRYIERAQEDIHVHKQVRLVVTYRGAACGLVDLYDADFRNRRAGVGIVVEKEFRNLGIAKVALELLAQYAFEHLRLHQLYAEIPDGNTPSIKLFEDAGYHRRCTFKDWIFDGKDYKNVHFYQYIHHVE